MLWAEVSDKADDDVINVSRVYFGRRQEEPLGTEASGRMRSERDAASSWLGI